MSLMLEYGRYRTGLMLLNFLLWGVIHTLPVLIGVFTKGLFDALSGEATVTSAWTFLALFVAMDLSRLLTMLGGTWFWSRYWSETVLLIRRNMLNYLLGARGSRRLADSPSEAIMGMKVNKINAISHGPMGFSVADSSQGRLPRARSERRVRAS